MILRSRKANAKKHIYHVSRTRREKLCLVNRQALCRDLSSSRVKLSYSHSISLPPPPHLPHTLPHSVIFSLPAQQEAAFCNIGERGGWGGGKWVNMSKFHMPNNVCLKLQGGEIISSHLYFLASTRWSLHSIINNQHICMMSSCCGLTV